MIPTVYNLEEAQNFFLTHSSGKVMLIDGDRKFAASAYVEATEFYNNK